MRKAMMAAAVLALAGCAPEQPKRTPRQPHGPTMMKTVYDADGSPKQRRIRVDDEGFRVKRRRRKNDVSDGGFE